MWRILRVGRIAFSSDSVSEEVILPTLQIMIGLSSAFWFAFFVVAAAMPALQDVMPALFLVIVIVALMTLLALRVMSHHVELALSLWLLATCMAIVSVMYLLNVLQFVFFLALIPFAASAMMSWPAGIAAEVGIILLLAWLSSLPGMSVLAGGAIPAAAVGGALAGILGWASTTTSRAIAQWSVRNYARIAEQVTEARQQRAEMRQIQEDLTQVNRELARLTDRLRILQHEADDARRAKEQFVANVSHELRTPLNMIIGFSEMITAAPAVYGQSLPPALLSDIEAIRVNSQHLASLVDDVLDLSRIEAQRVVLMKESVAITQVVEAAAVAVRPLFESKGLALALDLDPALPPVMCDSTRIRQVILNLLSNAGRYTDRGGVTVHATRQADEVVISVADTGPGISAENQRKLFEPFQQLDGSLRRRQGGTGLGLSISKEFVEMHRGRMWLDSTVGAGTTFYFTLPIETPGPDAEASRGSFRRWFNPYWTYQERSRRSLAPAPDVRPRYVILEKGKTLQRLLSHYAQGVEVLGVSTMNDALVELGRSPAQCLVINATPSGDSSFPQERLATLPYSAPVVTCWVPGDEEVERRLGVVRYLVKPVTREVLLSTLASVNDSVRTVLVVDDHSDALQLFARMISSAGKSYRVLRASNGQRALAMLRERRPDVMLLDLMMPKMGGFQVLEEKSKDAGVRDIPVVIISSRDPTGEPIVSNMMTVTWGGSLSVPRLLGCIEAISEVLSPLAQSAGQPQPENPAG